ncbi:RagB/SusD family nutrient uptake outer membrane protein [Flavobacterium sufflavum]|uniref:RagB/SusD family nutrient uptake outer membrane protein n=1 Tax=Flavobacterium sufflavum TaxID=1921138 RepID=A0A437L2L3_9FLAO|nr:RagB/SusD family nutrient uptake outer membrane protein [Flavobacterium sufflavum]RVT79555.1 RagB/SusD family nutrient uptake outer membrane protein [Flavobacterium sufflavum]
MQTKIKTILAIFILFVSASSCDNYLDLRPQDGIVRDEFWKTKEDIQAAVIGIYSSLLSSPPGVSDNFTMTEYLFMYGELRGGMLAEGLNVTEDQRDIMNSNIIASNEVTSWAAFYRTINYCNTVIDLAPAVKNEDPTLTDTQLKHFLSEALAIRAYLYFTLARTFKDVPLKLKATLSDAENFQIPTSTQSEIFTQVIKDLKLADEYAVENYGSAASNKGRITTYAINAMLADVYLWTEDYQGALDATKKLTDSGKFALIETSSSTWFNTVFAKGNSTESVFEFQYTTSNLGPFYNIFSLRPQFKGGALLMDQVFGIDSNNAENRDIRGDFASLISATGEIYKFTGLNNFEKKTLQEADTHWFVYRYADVLLMQAEALTRLGGQVNGQAALDIIADIRSKRRAISQTAKTITATATNKDDIIDYILAERARELAFEGKRWYDVLRVARANNYERKQLLIDLAVATAPVNQQQSIIAKIKDPNSHYLPINANELYTNKALVQNPFYK